LEDVVRKLVTYGKLGRYRTKARLDQTLWTV
jgi:hypothetical protein